MRLESDVRSCKFGAQKRHVNQRSRRAGGGGRKGEPAFAQRSRVAAALMHAFIESSELCIRYGAKAGRAFHMDREMLGP